MRRLFFALAVTLVCGLLAAPAAAAPPDDGPGRKPLVALMPVVNNANQKHTGYMVEMVTETLYAKFSPDRCLPVGGQPLADALRRQGIEDWRAVDGDTLNAALRASALDYAVRAEIGGVSTRQRVHFPDVFLLMKTWTASVPVTIVVTNLRTGRVVYEATISEWAKHDAIIGFADRHYAIRIALTRVLDKFAQENIALD